MAFLCKTQITTKTHKVWEGAGAVPEPQQRWLQPDRLFPARCPAWPGVTFQRVVPLPESATDSFRLERTSNIIKSIIKPFPQHCQAHH